MFDFDPFALDTLAALADEGSFERAAQRLLVTQSAVSQRLRALEVRVGQPLVVRARPLRLTDAGKRLLRLARQTQALHAEAGRDLGLDRGAGAHQVAAPVRIAVNADSLATWVLPALDALVQGGLSLELVVDDQDFTHDWLREGAVLGCVSTVHQALRGCQVLPLGVMPYIAVASPAFIAQWLPQGLDRHGFSQVPFLVFNRKDDMQQQWVAAAFGVRQPRLRERFVPSSDAYVRAACMGWGIGVLPEMQVRSLLATGELVGLHPQVRVPVALHWHAWRLGAEPGTAAVPPASIAAGAPSGAGGADALAQIGAALAAGARHALEPAA